VLLCGAETERTQSLEVLAYSLCGRMAHFETTKLFVFQSCASLCGPVRHNYSITQLNMAVASAGSRTRLKNPLTRQVDRGEQSNHVPNVLGSLQTSGLTLVCSSCKCKHLLTSVHSARRPVIAERGTHRESIQRQNL
jgi:hypothetical protein